MKSIFFKFLTAFLAVIFVLLLAVAIILYSVVSYSNVQSKTQVLQKTVTSISTFMNEFSSDYNYETLSDLAYIYDNDISRGMKIIPKVEEGIVSFVVDTEGRTYYIDDEDIDINTIMNKTSKSKMVFNKSIIENMQASNPSVYVGRFDDLFKSEMISCSSPIVNNEGKIIGYSISSISNSEVVYVLRYVNRIIMPFVLVSVIITILASYFITKWLTTPLAQMSKAMKAYSKGHFDARVQVKGNDEIAALAKLFNSMADDLSELEESRRSFIANVSHDLRTPMTTISGFIDSILCGAIPKENEAQYLELISSEIRRLSRLVTSLLDLSRLEAGERKFVNEPFDITEIARQILISFEQKIYDKMLDVHFECDEDNMIAYGDKDAIYQVLYNLCDNAIKFSYDKGLFKIDIRYLDDKIKVSVYNDGIGIKEEDVKYLFDRFYKTDKSRGLDKTGVGLGLYISKTIINAQNGEIGVNSVYGEWCEFNFTISQPNKNEIKAINKKERKAKTGD